MSSSTDVARPAEQQIGSYNAADLALARYLGLNPDNPADRAAVAVCRQYDLDPLLKHVIVIPKGGVYITRDGLLHVAHRSGQFDGIVVEQDPKLVDGEWVAKVSVYRKDMRHPFTYPGRYPVNGSNRQYAQEMALKSAEAHALRRAFSVTGIPAIDEQRPEAEVTTAPAASGADRLRSALGQQSVDAMEATGPDLGELEVVAGDVPSEPLTDKTRKQMFAELAKHGITDPDVQRAGMTRILGRDVESRSSLTEDEARAVILELQARA